MSQRTVIDVERDGDDFLYTWTRQEREDNDGRRIAEIQVHPRGEIIEIYEGTIAGEERRVAKYRQTHFASADGDMWFPIDLDIEYAPFTTIEYSPLRTIVDITERWKIQRHAKFRAYEDDSDEGMNDQTKRHEGMNEQTKRHEESKGNKMKGCGTRPGGWTSKAEGKGGIRCPCICCRLKGAGKASKGDEGGKGARKG